MNGDAIIEQKDILINEVKGMKGWLKFLGILTIIGGALYALTLVGIIIAWLPIWIGIILLQAGNSGDQFISSGTVEDLRKHLAKLRMYFVITGIVMIISLAFFVIFFIVLLITGISLGSFSNWYNF